MKSMNFRIGLGQDSHPVKKVTGKNNNPLKLGGVLISEEIECLAESDGDVIIHALCNALNTAVGYGSLSLYATEMCRLGIRDSREYLKKALLLVKDKGYRVSNISISVETNAIKLEDYREKMQKVLSAIMEIKNDEVGISFTSGEGLTSFGKGEGIQVLASVLITKILY